MAELPQTSHIKLDLRGGVLHLWLNRPERRNALSSQMVAEIAATFAAIAADRAVRIVILRGAGGTFCAGGDIASMSVAQVSPPPGAPDELRDNNRRFGAVLEAINAAPQVVIAAVEGYAMGGGFGLACVADITIATVDAKFALSEATIGVVAAAVSPFVVQRIGLAAARRLGVTAVRINASRGAGDRLGKCRGGGRRRARCCGSRRVQSRAQMCAASYCRDQAADAARRRLRCRRGPSR